jgi:glycosyltransferase involved in cell wall biosynthesis
MTTSAGLGLRVYWLTSEFFPPEIGGTGVMAACLSRGLAERGVAIQVITRQTLPRCARWEWIGKLRVRRIRPAGRMKGAGWTAFPVMLAYLMRLAIVLILDARRYDVVIISGMKIIPLAAVPICRLLRKKCVIRLESPFEIVEPISAESLGAMNSVTGQILGNVLMRMQRAVLSHADCVITISKDITNLLTRLKHPPSRIVSIPNAIDLERFKPVSAGEKQRLRDKLGFPTAKTIVLFAGRLSRAKGVMMLIESWPTLILKDPSLFLVLVGSGKGSWDDCEAELVEYVRSRELKANVTLAGESDRVHAYLQAGDLFISPSDYEGFGLTIVEALACAMPVVSTSVGIAREIIRDGSNGFVCPAKDPAALSEAVERALKQRDQWPAIGRLAREAVADFGIAPVIQQYVALCRELQG